MINDKYRRAVVHLLRAFSNEGLYDEFDDWCHSCGPDKLADLIEPEPECACRNDLKDSDRRNMRPMVTRSGCGRMGRFGSDFTSWRLCAPNGFYALSVCPSCQERARERSA